jgi:hypothetical protein
MKTNNHFSIASLSLLLCTIVLVSVSPLRAQGPLGRDFGFGLSLGDPLGVTIKYWMNPNEALVGSLGADYFGSPRLNIDYHWHFNAFNSSVVKLYAGPGISFGFGGGRSYLWYGKGHDYYFIREGNETGIGARILLGLNVIPRNTPVELYMEFGPLIGISPAFGSSFDAAVGVRFYL